MLKRVLSYRLAGVLVFLAIGGGLLFMVWGDGKAVEKTKKGWLGVSVQELTPSLRETMKVGNRSGLLITDVVKNSPADDANLREEDVLLSFDGKAVEKAAEFTQLVRNTPPDKKVKVKILRDSEERELEVTIGARKSGPYARSFAWSGDAGHSPNFMVWGNRPRLGVQIQELNKDLAPYFKVEEKSGVLVLSVSENSPAEKAGLKAGDVITRVSDEKITDYDDLVQALRDYEEGDKVSIEYVRQGKSATVQAELENDDGHGFRFYAPDREGIRLPLQNKIHIQRFDSDEGGELEILMPEIHRRLESLEKGMIEREIQDRLRNKLERLPKRIELDNLRTI
jgi:C-terminal processing protease CtpA/Prc